MKIAIKKEQCRTCSSNAEREQLASQRKITIKREQRQARLDLPSVSLLHEVNLREAKSEENVRAMLSPHLKNLIRAMKLTVIMTFFLTLNVSASVYSQQAKLSLDLKEATVREVLKQIEEQSKFKFLLQDERLDIDKRISINVKEMNVENIMQYIFDDEQVNYVITDKNLIIITPAVQRIKSSQESKVAGKVVDSSGQPLPGVTVVIKGTSKGGITGADGSFSLTDVTPDDILVFSFMGMRTIEQPVGTRSEYNITMEVDAIGIDEVVAIGYGVTKKEDLSAAISVVADVERLKERPVLRTESMIQGRVPGVTIVSNGGHPNSAPSVIIRGTGSQSESVLYVVNGVPGAPFNPEDVESVTILKDAASAAIYGAHSGAGGVILVTTRQSKQGRSSVEYSGFFGLKSAWKLPQSLSAEDEATVAALAYTNAGLTVPDGWNKELNPYAFVTRTDWMDEVFRTATVQRHNITVNGGTDKMKSLFQARWEEEEGTLLNTYNKNISLRFNADYQINKYLQLKQEIFWNTNDNRGTDTQSGYSGTILSALYMPRSATAYYEDGSFGGVGPVDSDYLGIHGDVVNPVATLLRNQGYVRYQDILSVSELHLTNILKGLEYTSRFSYRAWNSYYKNFSPKRTEPGKPNNRNSLTYETGKSYHWMFENTLNYNRIFNKHNINIMASMTAKEDGYRGFGLTAHDFDSEEGWAQFLVNAQTYAETNPWDSQYEDRNASYVARISYSYGDRYFVTGSFRNDIAGRLAADNRGKNYPGVTAAWKVSSEPWFNVSGLDLFKIRASWGKIGNLGAISRYYGYPTLSSGTTNQVGNGAPSSNTLYNPSAHNTSLSWETSEQTDLGIDLLLFNKQLNVTADYFWKKTYNLIKQQDTEWTDTYGISAPYINQGEISNKGFEFAANWSGKISDMSYDLGFNFATLKNEVTYIDEDPESYWAHEDYFWRYTLYPHRSKVGEPYYSYWLVENDGIFQSNAEVTSHVNSEGIQIQPNAKPGDLRFVDQNDDGKINDNDRIFNGNSFPKITYGFSGNFYWKNWDLSFFFQGVGGVKLFHAMKQSTLNASEQGYNRWDKILDAWSETNTGSSIPRISASDPNQNFGTNSDWYLESGNYLRLKTLLFGYTFRKTPWNGTLRLYFSGENLATFTNYSGMDPEVGGKGFDGGQFPVSRIISFGAKVNF